MSVRISQSGILISMKLTSNPRPHIVGRSINGESIDDPFRKIFKPSVKSSGGHIGGKKNDILKSKIAALFQQVG
ncbi:hypothetical protein A9R05_26425 [Burkholderia sp. KK1]|nr:hypothetical protein A9R05_26425 [Burkholderia sp. KK1]